MSNVLKRRTDRRLARRVPEQRCAGQKHRREGAGSARVPWRERARGRRARPRHLTVGGEGVARDRRRHPEEKRFRTGSQSSRIIRPRHRAMLSRGVSRRGEARSRITRSDNSIGPGKWRSKDCVRLTPPGKPSTWFPGEGLVTQARMCHFLSNMSP